MKKFALVLMVLLLVFSSYGYTREDFLESELGFTSIHLVSKVPESLQKTLISVAVVTEKESEPKFNMNGEIIGKISNDYIELAGGIYSIENVFIAEDPKGNAVIVIWTSQLICFVYDAVDPVFSKIGVSMMLQVLYLHQGKSVKIFVK